VKCNLDMVACPTSYVWRLYHWKAELPSNIGTSAQLCGKTALAAARGGRKGLGPDSKVHRILELY
jgi:hypothetical protein